MGREQKPEPPIFYAARIRIDRQTLCTMIINDRYIDIELDLNCTYDRGMLHPVDILPIAHTVAPSEDLGPPPHPIACEDYVAEASAYAVRANLTPVGNPVGLYIDQNGKVVIGLPDFPN